MKKHTSTIIAIITCLLTVICLFQITVLKNQINTMQSSISSQIGSVNASVNNIYSNIDNMLEEQANLLADSSYEYGVLDADKMTVKLFCSITPKEFSPVDTTAILICNGQEYPMTLDNGAFWATLDLPVFDANEVTRVQFTEGGVTRTESLDWSFTPHNEFLPEVYATLGGSASSSGGSYHRKGTVDVDVDCKETVGIQSIALMEVLDGEEINRTPIELDENVDSQPYAAAKPVREVQWMIYHGSYNLDETYEIPNGSTHELYIEVVDGYDLHYRVLIDRWIVDENGDKLPDESEWMWLADIYDASGNLLYEADK